VRTRILILVTGYLSIGHIQGQTDVLRGMVARFTFDDGRQQDDVTGTPVKLVGVASVEDRFGNPKCAYFLQGNRASYINLGVSDHLKPKVGSISFWFKIASVQYSGFGTPINPIKNLQPLYQKGRKIRYVYGRPKKLTSLNGIILSLRTTMTRFGFT
jgi:hypothetical protein